jgi:integrase
VPLQERLLFGFLARDGMRLSEALGLSWRDVDLERGTVSLDANKTDEGRTRALDAGAARALRVSQRPLPARRRHSRVPELRRRRV